MPATEGCRKEARETDAAPLRTASMVPLLMDLARIECRVGALAAAAGERLELVRSLARASHYLRLRASEATAPTGRRERRNRLRAWLRGAA
jgi:hypothetical protein